MLCFVDEKTFKKLKAKNRLSSPKSTRTYKEGDLVKACLQYLALRGYVAIRNNTGTILIERDGKVRAVRNGLPGSSDILACGPGGRFIAIECKTPKGRVTKHQLEFLEKISKLGGVAIVVRSVEELHKKLEEIFGK